MSEFAEFDEHFGPDDDAFANRWRNFGPPRDGYYPLYGGGNSRVKHVKAPVGGVPAFDSGTLTLGSATCTEYTCSASGVLSAGSSLVCYNAAGEIAGDAYGIAALNEAGLWVWIVEAC